MPRDLRFTRAVRAGIATDRHHGAVVPPIHLSSTFAFEGFGQARQYDYTRSGNPTRDILAEAIADLEGGTTGIVTSSGMSAVALVLQLLKPGDRIVATHDCYGGTHRLLTHLAKRGLFEVEFVDFSELRTANGEQGHPDQAPQARVEGSACHAQPEKQIPRLRDPAGRSARDDTGHRSPFTDL